VGMIRSWEVVMKCSVQLGNCTVSLVQFYHI
jgi:hypothetical protein